MPELPEVETIRRGLEPYVLNRRIDEVAVFGARTVRRQAGGAGEFIARVTGREIVGTGRRGKFLWLVLDDASALAVHLGMSGQFRVGDLDSPLHKHTRARFRLSGENGAQTVLDFRDQRTFGWLHADELVSAGKNSEPVPAIAEHIAFDLLDPNLNILKLAHRMQRSRSAVKRLLLNQEVVSGIGNIYADEMLWLAKVNGEAPAAELSTRTLTKLLRSGIEVLNQAIAAGGTSFDSLYVNVNGSSGYFSRSLNAYGQAGKPCARCGTAIVRQKFMNRSSYICPRCQS